MKHYRVKKDTCLRKEWAIISYDSGCWKHGWYLPIEDIRDKTPVNGEEYISTHIVEHEDNSDFFERVYKDDVSWRLYKTADQLKKAYEDAFSS